jgi:hypothetical protein
MPAVVYTKDQQVVCFSKTCLFFIQMDIKNVNKRQAGDGSLFFKSFMNNWFIKRTIFTIANEFFYIFCKGEVINDI